MKRGRPKKSIDGETVEKLAALNCSTEEIAEWFSVDKRTIERRFMPHLIKGRANGRISLKRKMFEMAMGGNSTLCIWLSKQMLGYTEKVEQRQEVKAEVKDVTYVAHWGGVQEPATPGNETES